MLVEAVRKTAETYRLFAKGGRVIVGVSGGPDSLTLLLSLLQLAHVYGLKLSVVHVDHGVRSSSVRDAKFVAAFCRSRGIPITVVRIKLPADKRGSLEELMRAARFRALCSQAKKLRAAAIALGHTLDDQAETVLMRLLRGSGLYGLSAIQPKRMINGCCVVRPLIETSRRDIESFLKERRIKARTDRSNAADIFLRNRVRKYLLPLLEKSFNPRIKSVLAATARTAADDYDFLEHCAAAEFQRMGGRILLRPFLKLHPAMQKLCLRLAISRCQGDTRRITHTHILELLDLVQHRPAGSLVHLPKGLCVAKLKDRLRLSIKA